jgi:type IV pilus assembly protein PilA
MRNKQKGFSLIELLIVVAIILIIAAIAIPNLLRSKMAANEASAVGSLRTMNTASIAFSTSYGNFPTKLADLGPVAAGTNASSTSADLLDAVLAKDPSSKSGYTFTYTAPSPYQTYTIVAQPIVNQQTGSRFFFTDQSGVIRANVGAAADITSTPIG